jgi:hypothetical protein
MRVSASAAAGSAPAPHFPRGGPAAPARRRCFARRRAPPRAAAGEPASGAGGGAGESRRSSSGAVAGAAEASRALGCGGASAGASSPGGLLAELSSSAPLRGVMRASPMLCTRAVAAREPRQQGAATESGCVRRSLAAGRPRCASPPLHARTSASSDTARSMLPRASGGGLFVSLESCFGFWAPARQAEALAVVSRAEARSGVAHSVHVGAARVGSGGPRCCEVRSPPACAHDKRSSCQVQASRSHAARFTAVCASSASRLRSRVRRVPPARRRPRAGARRCGS